MTTAAVIAGGLWAYFKYVRGRTFRPRLEVGMSGQWRTIDGKPALHARVTVKNIGTSDVKLLQTGTGLRVSALSPTQPAPPAPAAWNSLKVFGILAEHQWIEPAETVADDLLIDLGATTPIPVLFETRLVWRWSRRGRNIVVFARQVIPADAAIKDTGKEARP